MRIVHFDAASGISGDMCVGALLDAGRERGLTLVELSEALGLLEVGGFRLASEPVEVGAIRATKFDVLIDEAPHFHRDWATIRRMIEEAGKRGLGDGVVERSLAVFEVLARAEAEVHGVEPDRVHFHEVGAIDSIVDIVGAAFCLDALRVEACFVGAIPSGSGYVETEHGRLPVPAPATALLLRGFEVIAGDGDGELVTPTGAAILNALARPLRPQFIHEAVGYGAGSRRLADRPNVLRVLLGQCDARSDEQVVVIEADIDDMTPVALAHVAERLRADGARDVSIAPVVMKKGRLGMRLSVLCDLDGVEMAAARILAESSSIGLRYRAMGRIVLPREFHSVETEYGTISLKIVDRPGGERTAEPEFEDVARAAREHDQPLAAVHAAALAVWQRRSSRS